MDKKDKIVKFFNNEFPFNQEGLDSFVSAFETKSVKKHTLILQYGETENLLSFLDNGVVREFYSAEKNEKNMNFYTKPCFLTDFSSFLNSSPTRKFQESLTDLKLRTISVTLFNEFMDKYECGRSFVEQIFQRLLEKKEAEEYKNATKTPDELYLDILKSKKDWLQKIPQYHIASYLGITPETLSRIRSRIS